MKSLLSLILAAVLFTSCTETETKQTVVSSLAESDMYDAGIIKDYVVKHPVTTDTANALFLQAIDAYRNKKDIGTARSLFIKSIQQYPTAKAYYELGNASMDAKDYKQALAAFHVGEQLGFEPLSKLLYNTACAYSLSQQQDSALTYLEYAMEAGYTNGDQIMKDPDIAFARQSDKFQTVYQLAMGGSGDPETQAWQSFKRGFIQASFPLVLNRETGSKLNHNEYISYEFEKFIPEMRGARFSRDVGQLYYYYTKVADGPDFSTLIYAVENEIQGDGAPIGYMLVSFSPKGKLIDKMVVGGQREVKQPYRVGTVQASGQFQVKEYKEDYEKNPEENGYADNRLLSSSLIKTTNFRIGADGHFEEDGNMIGMR